MLARARNTKEANKMIEPANLNKTDATAVHPAPSATPESIEAHPIPESFKKLSKPDRLQTTMAALPGEFIAQENGVAFMDPQKDATQYYHLCGPLIVESKARTSTAGDWSTHIRFLIHDNKVVSMVVPDSDLQCKLSKVIARLVQRGFWIAPDTKHHNKMG